MPGGEYETYRPTWESDRIDFAGRSGFVRLAAKHNVPIVPVVAIGGQETRLFLGQGRRITSALQLERLLRLKVLPAVLGPPFGTTILDLPARIPLPAKITTRVLKPVDLRERLGRNPDPGLSRACRRGALKLEGPRRALERFVEAFAWSG